MTMDGIHTTCIRPVGALKSPVAARRYLALSRPPNTADGLLALCLLCNTERLLRPVIATARAPAEDSEARQEKERGRPKRRQKC